MTYSSVLKTMPNAIGHRGGVLPSFERVFSLVSISGIKSGEANFDTMEVAALGVRPSSQDKEVRGVLFDIPEDEFSAFVEREHRYKVVKLPVIDANMTSSDTQCTEAWVVTEQTDDEYKSTMNIEEYEERVGRYYKGQLWGRSDLKPMRKYLSNCIIAADAVDRELGSANNSHLINLMDMTYLSDGWTIREYVTAYSERFDDEVMSIVMRTVKSNKNHREEP